MKITFLGQGLSKGHDAPVGEQLRIAFSDEAFVELLAFVAFASKPAAAFLASLAKGRPDIDIQIYVGVDQRATSKEALEELMGSGIHTSVFYTVSRSIYHPKVYLFQGKSKACLIVGSSNLTATGLYSNVESSIRIDFDPQSSPGQELLGQVLEFFHPILVDGENVQAVNPELLSLLQDSGRLPTEGERESTQESEKASKEGDPAFDALAAIFPSRHTVFMPDIGLSTKPDKAKGSAGTKSTTNSLKKTGGLTMKANPNAEPPVAMYSSSITHDQERRFWVEARTLTGGSRNQLDLSTGSKFGRLPGSLFLFGLSGVNTDVEKEITIRYKGVDYYGNRIYFPETSAGKSNMTWRMQMNGVNASKTTLTPFGRTDFVDKIFVFEQIATDHYALSLVNISAAELAKFQASSKRWDQNRGPNGRCFGEL